MFIFLLLLRAGIVFESRERELYQLNLNKQRILEDDTFMINVKQISDNSSLW